MEIEKQNKTKQDNNKKSLKNPQEILRCNRMLVISAGLILFRESIKANHEEF